MRHFGTTSREAAEDKQGFLAQLSAMLGVPVERLAVEEIADDGR